MSKPETSSPMVCCRVCGRGFATEKLVARVKTKLNSKVPDELVETCPGCRASEFGKKLGETVGKNGTCRAPFDGVAAAGSRSLNDEELT